MSRKALIFVAHFVVLTTVGLGAVSASAGLLEDVTGSLPDLPGGGGGGGGGGGIDLPDLPGLGGGGGGGGGGGLPLPGGGGTDDVTDPILPGEPAPTDPEEPVPPDDGSTEGGDVGSGPGGRGTGETRDSRQERRERRQERRQERRERQSEMPPPPPIRNADGTPTSANPSVTIADFGPAPIGVPNFVIDQFTIPPFLLPIYQSCGTEYGIPWQVLASINRIETAFGTNLNVSYAGAEGWMQFMPATWEAYGVDANNDGRKDPYNPVDAICAAARYLNASGGETDLERAIFAYNHADWYVDEVMLYAEQYGKIPSDLIGSLTGLTEGARFPIAADARYADDISEREEFGASRATAGGSALPEPATRKGINIYSREGAPVVAVNDGVVRKIGRSKKLGRYVVLEDNYGNRFTYAELGPLAKVYPVAKDRPKAGGGAADDGDANEQSRDTRAGASAKRAPELVNTEDSNRRMYAFPERQGGTGLADPGQMALDRVAYESFDREFGPLKFDPKRMELRELEKGSKVIAGTVLAEVAPEGELAPHVHFGIQPAGRGAPTINPKPILDGWKLLEATHLYRASGKDPFADSAASSGQVLLLSKDQAARRLVEDPRVEIYECGVQDVQTGQIDVRVMRALLYLAESGFRLTVTSLKCGHSVYTSSGNISAHSVGAAVDIAQINGLPVLGNQGGGSITEALVKQLLELQGSMVPDQIISLMDMGGPTFAMGDHADHVHVGYSISGAPTPAAPGAGDTDLVQVLEADQWQRLIRRLGEIENPEVPERVPRRASAAHRAE
jgi:murein DD-endopeptidase MepM/ murein hydrolase activator NlpD